MIIDTSALVAALKEEPGFKRLLEIFAGGTGIIPAPVLVEFERVTALPGNRPDPLARLLIDRLISFGVTIAAFEHQAAMATADANEIYGSGNGRGLTLNLLDLMVYGAAQVANLPILCTGNDFAATDALIHPASRVG